MGDELGLRNDPHWAEDPAHAADNRWMHRPPMDWAAAERRHDEGTVEGRIWAGLRRLASARRGARAVHAQGRSEPLWTSNHHVLALLREHAGERLLLLANFTPLEQAVQAGVATGNGFRPAPAAAGPDGRPLEARGDFLVLAPYQFLWIA